MAETNLFRRLEIDGWRQFNQIEIEFHPRLTVITGANAAGKTTILDLLARHFGWESQLVGTPRRGHGGAIGFFTGLFRRSRRDEENVQDIGVVEYTSGFRSEMRVPVESGGPAFSVNFVQIQPINGAFLPSHRPTFSYSEVGQLPTRFPNRAEILQRYLDENRTRYRGGSPSYPPVYRLKEALIGMATFGYGNVAVEPNPELVDLYEGFVETLRAVLPPSLLFENLSIRTPEVILETGTGEFPIDAVSGGVAAIIDLAFQIHLHDNKGGPFAVVIDEPENHLHPELQRSMLPGFIEAFPLAQFIVATHSPFVVGSVAESNVYVLRHIDDPFEPLSGGPSLAQTVSSELLDTANKAGTSNEILRDVLGLEVTMPIWVVDELNRVVDRYAEKPLDGETVKALRQDLDQLGIADVLPDTVQRLAADDPAD